MRALATLLLPLALAACGSDETAPQGGVSASEARELDQAAEALDANASDANAAEIQP